jgi:hypothetical protein
MADDAVLTISATILPDEIAKTIASLSAGYTPAGDGTEKWYYKTTTVQNSSQVLIQGSLLSEGATGTAHDTIAAANDIVKFLYINNSGSNTVYLTLDGTTAATGERDAIIIPNGKAWFGCLQCEVEELLCITNTGTSICEVAAVIDDI